MKNAMIVLAVSLTGALYAQNEKATNSKITSVTVFLDSAVLNKDSGLLKWELTVTPNETKRVMFKFEVKYPKDMVVSML